MGQKWINVDFAKNMPRTDRSCTYAFLRLPRTVVKLKKSTNQMFLAKIIKELDFDKMSVEQALQNAKETNKLVNVVRNRAMLDCFKFSLEFIEDDDQCTFPSDIILELKRTDSAAVGPTSSVNYGVANSEPTSYSQVANKADDDDDDGAEEKKDADGDDESDYTFFCEKCGEPTYFSNKDLVPQEVQDMVLCLSDKCIEEALRQLVKQ